MRILASAAAAMLLLAGCASSEPAAEVPSVEVCPPEKSDLRSEVVRAIEGGATPVSANDSLVLTQFRGGSYLDPRSIFAAALWIDRYPGCFNEDATVAVYSLRDTLAAGLLLGPFTRERYEAFKGLILVAPLPK